jgi:A/G-specific adenine glycosylase
MLHAAAKEIVRQHAGKLPATAADLRTLPGIGRYTAAAIASIAFGERVAVVDGNVERVLGRVWGRNLVGEELWQAAQSLVSRRRPGDFNQAMMELGATVCLPRQPECRACPISGACATRGELEKIEKPSRQKKREIRYALNCRRGSVFLVKRLKHTSLMPGMWELPEIPSADSKTEAWLTLRHSITVTDYVVRVLRTPAPRAAAGKWVARSRVRGLPLTGLARKILRVAEVL